MSHTAFVYGSLMSADVVRAVIKRLPPMQPATLRSYARYRVKEQAFPAIVPEPGGEVKGQLLLELSDKEMAILDYYEDEDYYRKTESPVTQDGSATAAEVYIWKDECRHLLEMVPWDFNTFLSKDLSAYLTNVEAFMGELDADQLQT